MPQTACIYNLGETTLSAEWNLRLTGSVSWKIYSVVDGEAEIIVGGRTIRMRPRHLYLIPPFTPLEQHQCRPFTLMYVHFHINDLSLTELLESYHLETQTEADTLTETLLARLTQLCAGFELPATNPSLYETKANFQAWGHRYDSLPQVTQLEIGSCIRLLMSHFINRSKLRPPIANSKIRKAKKMIDEHPSGTPDIKSIAKAVGMRPESFSRAFRKEIQLSPLHYFMGQRLNRAKNLLAISELSVKEVANSCGFNDFSYFCRLFKKHTSLTPGEFRRGRATPTNKSKSI